MGKIKHSPLTPVKKYSCETAPSVILYRVISGFALYTANGRFFLPIPNFMIKNEPLKFGGFFQP
jgi:hypothetical protein